MRMLLPVLLALLMACGGAPVPDADQASPAIETQVKNGHVIQLFRPAAVGRKTKETIKKKRKRTNLTTAAGVVDGKESESTTDALVIHTVKEVNADGRPTVSEYRIDKLTVTDEKGERPLLEAGVVVTVRRAEKEEDGIITAGDVTIEEETKALLADLFSVEISKNSDDDTFGTPNKVAVGGSWNLTAERLRESARRAELPLVFGKLDGRMRLVGKGEVRGHECLEIEGGFRAVINNVDDAPEDFTERGGHLEASVWGKFPTDDKLPKLESRENIAISIELSGVVRGAPVNVHNVIEMERTESIEVLE